MGKARFLILGGCLALAVAQSSPGLAGGGGNVRVTNDQGSSYVSADVLGGTGTYTDATLTRCGIDRRMQNEPTIAIDPRDTRVRTAGSNDYCTIPTNGDAWAGFYRSSTSGVTWVDSLLPGYAQDNSPQGLASPVHQMALGGALAAGDPVQAWDASGRVFYMGNNFNRGIQNGNSNEFRDNTGDIWVATYAPASSDTLTDGSRYVRTVLLATNTFGRGQGTDKTGIQVDQANGNVYAAWSDFHGSGCNEIDFARSTDHGATFSNGMKISGSVCNNQGPNIAIGPQGQVYVSWFGQQSGSKGQNTRAEGMAFAASTDGGQSFSMADVVVQFAPFNSAAFSGNGARECGDAPFNCPTGQTFPRFDLAAPSLTTDRGNVDAIFMARLASGQGQAQFVTSHDGGATWSTATPVDPQGTGHQFFPWITASGGRLSAVYYDSRLDATYSPDRAPCNSATGMGSNCLAVWYSTSTNGGATWTHMQLTDTLTNPNYEQFGGRRVPFFGDYIMVAAAGGSIQAVWTDSRNVVAGTEPAGTDNDGDDVAGDPETGGTCTSSLSACFDATGGLDQNIYSQVVS